MSGDAVRIDAVDRVDAMKKWMDEHREEIVRPIAMQIVFDCNGSAFEVSVKNTVKWSSRVEHKRP